MSIRVPDDPGYGLPGVEALLGCTLALMTGYSQALQAALDPQQRLAMGARIGCQLGQLACRAELSPGLRELVGDLQQHWRAMTACTAESQPVSPEPTASNAAGCTAVAPPRHRWH